MPGILNWGVAGFLFPIFIIVILTSIIIIFTTILILIIIITVSILVFSDNLTIIVSSSSLSSSASYLSSPSSASSSSTMIHRPPCHHPYIAYLCLRGRIRSCNPECSCISIQVTFAWVIFDEYHLLSISMFIWHQCFLLMSTTIANNFHLLTSMLIVIRARPGHGSRPSSAERHDALHLSSGVRRWLYHHQHRHHCHRCHRHHCHHGCHRCHLRHQDYYLNLRVRCRHSSSLERLWLPGGVLHRSTFLHPKIDNQ